MMHKISHNDETKQVKKSSKKTTGKKSNGVDIPSCDIMEPTGLDTVTIPLKSDM